MMSEKATNIIVTQEFLAERIQLKHSQGFKKARWIEFCEMVMAKGYSVELYEARQTFSKYLCVVNGNKRFTVRISNHAAYRKSVHNGNCDFYVGENGEDGLPTTIENAVYAAEFFLGVPCSEAASKSESQ